MAMLNITSAAKAVDKDRGTIRRHIKSGKLSASKNASGWWEIDTSELIRVFGPLKHGEVEQASAKQHSAPPKSTVVEQSIKTLTEQLERQQQEAERQLLDAKKREEWLIAQLEREQERNKELELRMLPPVEAPEEIPKKGFWAKLLGK